MQLKAASLELNVTASYGVSSILATDDSGYDLLNRADSALYQAKHKGRNRVEYYYPEH